VSDYYVGLDLGQSNDYTALAVVQKVPTLETQTGKKGHELHLRHLERYPLKTSYTTIADHVRDLLRGPPFNENICERLGGGQFGVIKVRKPHTELVVDKTGVGVAVTDLLKERNLRFIGVTITGLGQKVISSGVREYSVPKQDLVAALEVPFHTGKLKIAEDLALWPTLRGELLSFRRKQNVITAHISYEHWRESDHDDLVLACALACWKATYQRKGTTRLKVIY
jgi:hypothetical protein